LEVKKIAAISVTMGKLIAGIIIAILASSAIAVGASTLLVVGPEGPEGPKGETGPQGPAGPQGEQGETGSQGATGPAGPAGPKGDTGDTGPAGPKGDTGDTGPQGIQGPQGEPGIGFEPTGYISVSAAAFWSNSDDAWIGGYLENRGTSDVYFYGSVQLPHGVTVTNVTFYWHDEDTSDNITFYLLRLSPTDTALYAMSSGTSTGSGGYGSTTDESIGYPTIDNSIYSYVFWVQIPVPAPEYASLRYMHGTIGFAYPT